MAIPVDSLITLSTALLLLAAWIVHHFASPGVPWLLKLLVTTSFWFGFGGIALLPIDLQITTVYTEEDEGDQSPNETYAAYMVVYWSTFVFGYGILPSVREALLSGQFTFMTRLRAGCKKAFKTYALLLCLAGAGILALAYTLHDWHVVPVLMALGNTYGLLLVSLLLGYGLVDLPRHAWKKSDPVSELRRRQIMAGNADEALFDAVWELQDCEALIDDVATKVSDYENGGGDAPAFDTHYFRCVDQLLTLRKSTANLSKDLQRRRTTNNRRNSDGNGEIRADGLAADEYPTLDYLAKLNARLQNAQADVCSAEQRWNELVAKAELYEQLANGTVPLPVTIPTICTDSICTRITVRFKAVGSRLRYIWLTKLRRSFLRFFGISSAILSFMVLWSEATLALPINVSPFALILGMVDKPNENGRKGFLFQLAALVPLLYIAICVYSSIFKLSFFGRYRLRGIKQSTSVACVFNAQYLVRLQYPLCYNYLFMIKYDVDNTNCAFSHVMHSMSTVPFLGTSFSVYAPLLILALCGFTLCNGYARLLATLGIEHEDSVLFGDRETLDEKANEGITLLRRHTERNQVITPTSPNDSASLL